MNNWNKVFLGFILAAAIAIVALTSVEMKVRSTGQKHIGDLEKKIESAGADIAKIVTGTAPQKTVGEKSPAEWGFEELRGQLRGRYYERGRAWSDCIVASLNEETLPPALPQVIAQIVITGPPDESGVETDAAIPEYLKGVVYVFTEHNEENSSTFLGRFTVDSEPVPTPFSDRSGNQKSGFRITLITADPVSEEEIEQIFETGTSRWTVYLTPPVDRIAGIFDQLPEEERQAIHEKFGDRFQPRPMPELTEEEKEGVDPKVIEQWQLVRNAADDPEAEAAQDFATVLDWLYQWRSSVYRDIEITRSDIAVYQKSENNAQAENVKLAGDVDLEEKRVEAMNVQREAVKELLEQYQAVIDNTMLQIEKSQMLNSAYVAKIAEYYALAVEIMEGRAEKPEQKDEEETSPPQSEPSKG